MKATKSLAVKYRPKTFNEVVEQESIKLILQEQLKTKTYQNCYLFTGGAGTGKTTCARILANEINEGKGNPIEIDGASNNGVDNVREIIQDAQFKALDAQFKVYILDECHMLSTGAWNAMLKLIEEPPAHTIFIFCTTEPQKIPATIISRVQRFDFQRITYDSIIRRLELILEWENEDICDQVGNDIHPGDAILIEYETEALSYITKIADGGMRDAITLLDKCLSYDRFINIENVVKALGVVDYESMISLTQAIIQMRTSDVIIMIEEIHRDGVDLKQFIKQYGHFILDVHKYFLINDFEYIQIPYYYSEQLDELLSQSDFLYLLMNKMIKLNAEIKWEPNPKPLIEATLILLCQEG